jgi:uncharacterized protein (DUF2336 family)
MLQELVELAREPSSEMRRQVMQKVSDLFVEGAERYTDREQALFGDILCQLLDKVLIEDRIKLSNDVAHILRTPHDLALKLANDEAEVASPILQFSPVLNEGDLIQLASAKSQDHLLAISRRRFLSESITDVIIERGESNVLSSVARNSGARFSDSGYSRLAEKAGADDGLVEALSSRSDLPEAVVITIMPVLDERARRRLAMLLQRDSGRARDLIDAAKSMAEAARGETRRERIEAKVLVAEVRDGKRRLEQGLDQLIFEKRMSDISLLLSELAQLPDAHLSNVLHKVNAAGIALVCRSLDVPVTVYDRLSRLRCEKLRLPGNQADQMVNAYEQLDKATAERTLRFHRVRSSVRSVNR